MPRTAEQNENMRKKRKKKLLANALKIFALIGYDELTIDDITTNTKCSHGLFYHYYKSKDEIFEDILKEFVTPLLSNDEIKCALDAKGSAGLTKLFNFENFLIQKGGLDTYALIIACSLHNYKTFKPSKKFKMPPFDIRDCYLKLAKQAISNNEINGCSQEYVYLLYNDLVIGYAIRSLLSKGEEKPVKTDLINKLN